VTPFLIAIACSSQDRGFRADTSEPFFPSGSGDETPTDTGSDRDTDGDSDTHTSAFDCKTGLPANPPYDSRTIKGSATAEDLDIDNHGYIIGSDRFNLYRSNIDGVTKIILPNVGNPQGIVVMPDNDVVLYEETGKIERVDTSGDRSTVTTDIYIPYGDATAKSLIYATAPDLYGKGKSTIVRIDPYADTVDELLEWEDGYPWGISFNEDYTALYVSAVSKDFDGYPDQPTRIYALKLDAKGDIDGDPELFVDFNGASYWTEGLAVDVCGNVYASIGGKVMRISKDGKTVDAIWESDDPSASRAISGLAFGHKGEGGTDPMKLYASNPWGKYAFEIDAGIYGKAGW
jgi:sugar lactone lactonase YvrE